ncbi:response regulator [Pseudochryseolinea flava]|uniref:DNA-binding response regulator n=1 Tax=Pseudochryseolinea flava TaxID=2059302 RepID=A0A364Y6Y6_9BACT|nr:response regulator transcription factor [Pseudochryseolinea flava]RAW01604.1 DNA-binding response regulator [Pseudochryseolinea flava]
MNSSITIAILDDHPVVIEGLRKILHTHFQLKELLEFHTGHDFIEYVAKQRNTIDVLLLDITLPDTNGVELCRRIKLLSPNTKVLGFSNHNDRALVMQLLANGANGYLLKNASASEIMRCITDAMNGQITFSEEIKTIISKPSPSDLRTVPPLTKREQQILKMIADGRTSNEISAELQVSPLTIETHRRNLMQKFDVKNVASLIKTAHQLKLLS